MKPGKKVKAVFFSSIGYDAKNIYVTEAGRALRFEPLFEPLGEVHLFSKELSLIFTFATYNPFIVYLIMMLFVISLGLLILFIILLGLRKAFPDWFREHSAKGMNEKEYLWQKSVLELYEEIQNREEKS